MMNERFYENEFLNQLLVLVNMQMTLVLLMSYQLMLRARHRDVTSGQTQTTLCQEHSSAHSCVVALLFSL